MARKGNSGGYSNDFASAVLVEAELFGDTRAARKYGITARTIKNYRKRTQTDIALSQLFLTKLNRATSRWADRLNRVIVKGLDFIERAAEEADPSIPESVEAVNASLRTAIEASMTLRLFDANEGGNHDINAEHGGAGNGTAAQVPTDAGPNRSAEGGADAQEPSPAGAS